MGPEGVAEVVAAAAVAAAAGVYGLQPWAEDPADERLDDVWDSIGKRVVGVGGHRKWDYALPTESCAGTTA